MPTLFLRIAWMRDYKGKTKNDIPQGAGSYVDENNDGGEVSNFKPRNGVMYGYAHIQNYRSLALERLGASKHDESIANTTVVFFAKNPLTGGQYIIGWYKNATLYRHEQENHGKHHRVKASAKDCYLVPEPDRFFDLPLANNGGPGQTNAWYVEDYHDTSYLKEVEKYIQSPSNYRRKKPKTKSGGRPWQIDAELKKKVEIAAMETVVRYFELRNYSVNYRHTENLGWDLEASLGKQKLLLEVKGLSGAFTAVELTPNEYLKSNRKDYRICIVSFALETKSQKLDIYYLNDDKWIDIENKELEVKEIKSARFIKK